MISKEEAIALLDQYLELEYNVDPIYKGSPRLKAHRLNVLESTYCWMIPECNEDEIHIDNTAVKLGSGPYFIDKETAEIYATGGAAHIQYEEDFTYFKEKGISLLDWFPLKSKYLNVKKEVSQLTETHFFSLEAKYETRETETKNYLVEHLQESKSLNNLRLRYKAIDGIDCLVLMSNIEVLTNKNQLAKKIIRLDYTGGFNEFSKTLKDLKKWIRINQKTGTDNYWIEVLETDWSKDFNSWILSANLEYR